MRATKVRRKRKKKTLSEGLSSLGTFSPIFMGLLGAACAAVLNKLLQQAKPFTKIAVGSGLGALCSFGLKAPIFAGALTSSVVYDGLKDMLKPEGVSEAKPANYVNADELPPIIDLNENDDDYIDEGYFEEEDYLNEGYLEEDYLNENYLDENYLN